MPVERAPARPEPHAPITSSPLEASPEASPQPRRNTWPSRLAVAGALVGAFGLGLAVPQNNNATDQQGAGGDEREYTAAAPVAAAGRYGLRLERITQRGRTIIAEVRTPDGFHDARLIEGAAAEVTVVPGAKGAESTVSLSDVHVTPTGQGFTMSGLLDPLGDAPVTLVQLRITTIQVRDTVTPQWGANLSKVWPVSAGQEPRVLRLSEPARKVEGGTVRLSSLLLWRDRVEAFFDLRGTDGSPGNRSELVGLEMRISIENTSDTLVGRAIAASKTELISAGQMVARFESVPPNAGPVVILATRMLRFVQGPWTWAVS